MRYLRLRGVFDLFTVSMLKPVDDVDLCPSSLAEEVAQNLKCIMGTPKFSVPLDRAFAIDGNIVDLPLLEAEAKLSNEIFRAVRRYEPRAIIESIRFEADMKGRIQPILEVNVYANNRASRH